MDGRDQLFGEIPMNLRHAPAHLREPIREFFENLVTN
jgi:hypothetical protein